VTVTVNNPTTGITLAATGYKIKGWQYVDLTWSGATSAKVNIKRDGLVIKTIDNTSPYTYWC
jgi:hypothetical protein